MGFDDNRSEESTCWESDVHCINIKDFERTPYDNNTLNLSISLKECALINVLPLGTLEGLWETTKFLISNTSVIQLINGDFCVTDREKAFNVKEKNHLS